jgi:uncharacterized surface protein with fasciclin (FAS1) repeats
MRRLFSLLITGALMIGLLAVPTIAGAQAGLTIGETVIAVSSDEGPDDNPKDFDILLAAVLADDLLTDAVLGQGDFAGVDLTVFAPNDQAFLDFTATETEAAAAAALGDLLGTETLQNIVLYHVVAGAAVTEAAAFTDMRMDIEMANGDTLITNNNRLIDGLKNRVWPWRSGPLGLDIEATNGIIHPIRGVLQPPTPPAPSIGETVIAVSSDEGPDDNPKDFDILLAAILADTVLTDAVLGQGDFAGVDLTVFAPNDQAFLDFTGTDTEAEAAAALGDLLGGAVLQDIVLYHVVAGAAVTEAAAFTDMRMDIEMANGDTLITNNNRLIDGLKNRVWPWRSGPLGLDIEASNGIIHPIRGVLQPPAAS